MREGYLVKEGIVYENGDIITEGPALEMCKRIHELMEQGDFNVIWDLIVNGDFKNLCYDDEITVWGVVLPGFVGNDISQIIGDIQSEFDYCTQGTKPSWRDAPEEYEYYLKNLPEWVKKYQLYL